MFVRAIRNITGLSMAGKIKKYVNRYKNSPNTFDSRKVTCSVSEGGYREDKHYKFYASCYCDDALVLPYLSDSLTIFSSKKFRTRLEAEATLDIEIMAASKLFKESSFYRTRYYPEDDVEGELLCCKNTKWSVCRSNNLYRCPECYSEFSERPKGALCNICGGLFI